MSWLGVNSDFGLGALLAYAAIGMVVGLAYFAALRINVRLYLGSGARSRSALFPALLPALLHAGRLLAVGAVFLVIAGQGAGALLAAFAGFICARAIALRGKNLRGKEKPA